MKQLIFLSMLVSFVNIGNAQAPATPIYIGNPGKQYELIGELGVKMGTTCTVTGFIVDSYHKGYDWGLNVVVQLINDKPVQKLIQIPLTAIFGKFGDSIIKQPVYLPALETGSTYRLLVYESGSYVGSPRDVLKLWQNFFQESGYYFQNRLVVVSGEKTNPVAWNPNQFIDTVALLNGTANNYHDTAFIETANWKLKLIGAPAWSVAAIGKQAEVFGKIKQTSEKVTFHVLQPEPRLIKLEDQLGKPVHLRGIAINLNQYWWFNYRGTDIYVEKMEELPGWSVENHYQAMEISGVLDQEKLPDIAELTEKIKPRRKLYYIVRKASWKPIKELLTPEMSFNEE